jgi:hypothetical protein
MRRRDGEKRGGWTGNSGVSAGGRDGGVRAKAAGLGEGGCGFGEGA